MPAKEEYWKDPEKHRAKTRSYALSHPDKIRESKRLWSRKKRTENPEWAKSEAKKHRERRSDEQKLAVAEYQKTWFAANPEYSRKKQAEEYAVCPQKSMVSNAKARAKRLGVPFDLDWRDVEIPKICPVLGITIVLGKQGFCDNSPSLDRLIPALGYVKSNVRVISYRANAIKRDATIDELREIVAYLERELG